MDRIQHGTPLRSRCRRRSSACISSYVVYTIRSSIAAMPRTDRMSRKAGHRRGGLFIARAGEAGRHHVCVAEPHERDRDAGQVSKRRPVVGSSLLDNALNGRSRPLQISLPRPAVRMLRPPPSLSEEGRCYRFATVRQSGPCDSISRPIRRGRTRRAAPCRS